MQATVYPSAALQTVTWSIVGVTGTATIDANGLITAVYNGTVWAKAVAVQDSTVMDSMLITLSNQLPVPVTGIDVVTAGGIPPVINSQNGSLQLSAIVLPANAGNTAVLWTLGQGSGQATVSANGLVTAISNGTIWVIATSVSNPAVSDSIQITINQVIPVASIMVHTQGNIPAVINSLSGTLQMVADVLPANASDQRVNWSIVNGTGSASISVSGLVTAITDGTVWAKAVSVANPSLKDSMLINIQQLIPVASIIVRTQGNVPALITTQGGTLQMVADVLPVNATDQRVNWSITNGSGTASISASGLVTALTNGTVYAKAVSVANPSLTDSMLININQFIPVTDLLVRTLGGAPAIIDTIPGTLQLEAVITPSNASDPSVTWSIIPVTGSATVSSAGLVTSITNGTVYAKAVSNSNSSLSDSLLITIDMPPAANDNLMLYPNPSSGILHLYSGRPHAAMSMVLLDAAGKKLKEWSLPANALQQTFTADLQALPAGIYILHSRDNSTVKHLRWVKIKS